MSDTGGMTPAEKRAEARRRRMAQSSEDRLARIKALSQGADPKDLPPISVSDEALAAAAPEPAKPAAAVAQEQGEKEPAKSTPAVAQGESKPAPAPAAPAPAAPATTTTRPRKAPGTSARAAATGNVSSVSASVSKPRSAATPASAVPVTPAERMMLGQLQERAYAAATRRWRLIHTIVSIVLGVALFLYVVWQTAEIHVDGEEVLGAMLVVAGEEMRVPVLNIFSIFLAVECALVGGRYAFDKAATSPPTTDVMQQLAVIGAASGNSAGNKVAGLAAAATNAQFLASLLLSDVCHMLVVFGIGIIVCAYRVGLDEIGTLVGV